MCLCLVPVGVVLMDISEVHRKVHLEMEENVSTFSSLLCSPLPLLCSLLTSNLLPVVFLSALSQSERVAEFDKKRRRGGGGGGGGGKGGGGRAKLLSVRLRILAVKP